jgi:hypothetical protein
MPIKVINTYVMAKAAGVRNSNCPKLSLRVLLLRSGACIAKIQTAGNNAAGTLIAAILLTVKDTVYPADKGAP